MENSKNCDTPQQLCSSQEHAKVSPFSLLKTELKTLDNFEEKLKKVIALMKVSMEQSGNPDFNTFWQAKKIVLEIFQEKISQPIKAAMWEQYCELVKEAHRLKEIFEQQSAFAVEQINIAILALEEDIAKYPRQLEKVSTANFLSSCEALKGNLSCYQDTHFQLGFLDAQASHINALRKELIKTGMRIRKKNQFFQRLSASGDHVFPRRKELSKKIGIQFIDDVEVFFSVNFVKNKGGKKLYILREEIKELQSVAKQLTLNTFSFTQVRAVLSKCWETVKEWEKERKQEQIKKKTTDKENVALLKDKIQNVKKLFEQGALSSTEGEKQLDQLLETMRSLRLGHQEMRELREDFNNAQKMIKKDEEKRQELLREREQERQEQIKNIENNIHSFPDAQNMSNHTSSAENIRTIKQQIHTVVLSDSEREHFQRLLMPIEDTLDIQEEEELRNLPGENKQEAMNQLKEVLQRRKQKRKEIKDKIEKYRKASGSSVLDFEKSLYFSDQLNTEKERLKKVNESIRQVESTIGHMCE